MNTDYVACLINEYVARKALNNSYSERAFAKNLGVSPGFLKLLFQKKKHLSPARAKDFSNRLSWNEKKKRIFLKSVLHTASARRGSIGRSYKRKIPATEFFEVSDWFYFAIIEFLKVKNGSVSEEEMAAAFRLNKTEVRFALDRLLELKVVQKKNTHTYSIADHYEIPSTSSEAIRKYHRQTLNKAIEAIDSQSFTKRDFRALTLAFDSQRVDEVKKFIENFVSAFDKKFSAENLDSVYQLNVAFFRHDKEK